MDLFFKPQELAMTAPKMRLMHGPFSPFVRKVVVSAIEKGMLDQIELIPTTVSAGKTNEELIMINPKGKNPHLGHPRRHGCLRLNGDRRVP